MCHQKKNNNNNTTQNCHNTHVTHSRPPSIDIEKHMTEISRRNDEPPRMNALLTSSSRPFLVPRSMNVVSLLSALKADCEITDQDGCTALHVAAGKGHAKVAIALVTLGCRLDATNCRGRTPTQEASHRSMDETACTLTTLSESMILTIISEGSESATPTKHSVMQARRYKARRRGSDKSCRAMSQHIRLELCDVCSQAVRSTFAFDEAQGFNACR